MNNRNMPIYIALGANMSNPKATFQSALKALQAHGVMILGVSNLWQSPAWPAGSGQDDYTNAVACVDFEGEASALLRLLHATEAEFGRKRTAKNAPRPLDLDLLDFKGQVKNTETLTIPHPRMLSRGFVLFPLEEIARDWRDPVYQLPLQNHIARLPLSDVKDMARMGPL